jgi:acetyl esterase/lipase
MAIDRRTLLTASGLAALAAAPALAQTAAPAPAAPRPQIPPAPPPPADLVIPLWPGTPPGGQNHTPRATPGVTNRNIDVPTLNMYRPADPDGSAIIVCPGGGYVNLSLTNEGSNPAKRFNAERITVFVLIYRMPDEGWADQANVPLADVQRAIRIVRARAAEFKLDPARVGVLGFSAGGHLAGSLATCHAETAYAPVDAADSQSAKPAFACLIYPVVTMMDPFAYKPGIPRLLGPNPSEAALKSRSNELRVTVDTAPCFLVHGMDDRTVPVENSIMMMQALREQKIKCEAHLLQEGSHGFGMGTPGRGTEHWPDLFLRWMRRLTPAAA